jgi:folate-dependent phosphoribosylglycinamide formyltransferase PurN
MYRIGWFSTGRDKAARDLLETVRDSINQGEIEAEIAFVFCNREPGESEQSDLFLRLVESYHIPLVCFSYQRYKSDRGMRNPRPGEPLPQWRLDYDREVMKRLGEFKPDLSVLAGYMLITGPEMCQRYDIINLHPAAPGGPKGMWQEVIWQLIESRADETGVMMHLVTPELDMGPPVTYCTFPIRGKDFDRYWKELEDRPIEEIKKRQGEKNRLFREIRRQGLAREFPLIVATIKAFSQGRVRITREKRVVDVEGRGINGYNLSREIDEKVRGVRL